MKRKAGRPKGSTKKSQSTDGDWVETLVSLYEDGASDVEVCKALRVSYNEYDKRYKADMSFRELVDYGRLAAKAWWMDLGRKAAIGGKGQFNFWYAVMKNRYGWSDKSEITAGDVKPIDQMDKDQIMAEILSHKDRLGKLFKSSNVLLSQVMTDESSTSN